MIASSNGGAMPAFTSRFAQDKHGWLVPSRDHLLADLDFSSRFAMNVKKLLSRRFALEFPASAVSHIDQSIMVESCMRSVTDSEAAVIAAVVIATLIDDIADGTCLPAISIYNNHSDLDWAKGVNFILESAPSYVSDCVDDARMKYGCYGLAMTHLSMSAWLTREGCAWFVEHKGFPKISSSSQALMYLISGNNCHNQIGMSWFKKRPDRARSRSWWVRRYPHLAFFNGAQAAFSGMDLFSPAFTN